MSIRCIIASTSGKHRPNFWAVLLVQLFAAKSGTIILIYPFQAQPEATVSSLVLPPRYTARTYYRSADWTQVDADSARAPFTDG